MALFHHTHIEAALLRRGGRLVLTIKFQLHWAIHGLCRVPGMPLQTLCTLLANMKHLVFSSSLHSFVHHWSYM